MYGKRQKTLLARAVVAQSEVLVLDEPMAGLEEIKAMLYGDLIVSSPMDRKILMLSGILSLGILLLFIRPIMDSFFDREASRVMGLRCWFWESLFFFLLGLVVSGASKSGGALLVFCMLVIVPATALLTARRLWTVLGVAVLLGVLVTWAGLLIAFRADLPANPTIIGSACLLFAAVSVCGVLLRMLCRLVSCFNTGGYGV